MFRQLYSTSLWVTAGLSEGQGRTRAGAGRENEAGRAQEFITVMHG